MSKNKSKRQQLKEKAMGEMLKLMTGDFTKMISEKLVGSEIMITVESFSKEDGLVLRFSLES